MSTGYNRFDKAKYLTFGQIDRQIQKFDLLAFTSPAAVQPPGSRMEHFVTVYATARPILIAIGAVALIPSKWRAVLNLFVSMLDEVSATFKAGKDLATAPVDADPKADMEPKLPVG
jgi:hypothetical protein